jgi:hypothetical protein
MVDFGSELLDTSSPSKKRKWTDTGMIAFLGLIIAFFTFVVFSGSFTLVFQHSLFGK